MTSTTKTSAPSSSRKISAIDFHNALIAEKGAHDASGFSPQGRLNRFDVIRRCLLEFPDPRLKLLDYGCNDGELFRFLKTGLGPCYVGVDINPKIIAHARKIWTDYCKGGRTKFIVGDVLTDATFSRITSLKPDVIVASGVLSYSGDVHHYPELLYRLFTCAQQAVIFNVLTADVPKNLMVPTKGMIRWHPEKLLKLVRACGCNSWELIRSYLHNDITVVMRKKWTHFK